MYIYIGENEARSRDLDLLEQTVHNLDEDATSYVAKLANLCYVNMVCLCWTYINL